MKSNVIRHSWFLTYTWPHSQIADNSVDVVVISETHIADLDIGPEEKAIFADIVRVLKVCHVRR